MLMKTALSAGKLNLLKLRRLTARSSRRFDHTNRIRLTAGFLKMVWTLCGTAKHTVCTT
jgi:hypothetical protein